MIDKFKQIDVSDARGINPSIVEIKVDGTRMKWDGTELISDRDCHRNERFPHIAQEMISIDAEVRGEIAIPNGNVLQLNKKENWHRARFYIFDLYTFKGRDVRGESPENVAKMIDEIVRPRFDHIRSCRRFSNFKAGWDFVERQIDRGGYAEGLILKDFLGRGYKIKKLVEAKLPIVGFEKGSIKGAFLIECPNGNIGKVSGTSVGFVSQYERMLANNEKPVAEIEYQFLTDNGVPFQPRLRQIGTAQDLVTS